MRFRKPLPRGVTKRVVQVPSMGTEREMRVGNEAVPSQGQEEGEKKHLLLEGPSVLTPPRSFRARHLGRAKGEKGEREGTPTTQRGKEKRGAGEARRI